MKVGELVKISGAPLAQLEERRPSKPQVAGSSPAGCVLLPLLHAIFAGFIL